VLLYSSLKCFHFQVDGSGYLTMSVEVNSIYTLTTMSVGQKGTGGNIPASKSFPLPYKDNFDGERLN